ncbi:TPA: hypothetical protein ACFM56_000670, partial [Neisseria meningitidis]
GGLGGYWGKISGYLKRKQPKTCVWVSAVGRDRNFAKVSGRLKNIFQTALLIQSNQSFNFDN